MEILTRPTLPERPSDYPSARALNEAIAAAYQHDGAHSAELDRLLTIKSALAHQGLFEAESVHV